jgi:hypothetical protein
MILAIFPHLEIGAPVRARTYRPVFDRLDTRIVLDSGAAAVCGSSVGATVLPIVGTGPTDTIPDTDWYSDGTPPPATPDPSTITIPYDDLTS